MDLEATLIVVAGRSGWTNTRHGIPCVGDCALRRAGRENGSKNAGIHARSDTNVHGFRRGYRYESRAVVVAKFRDQTQGWASTREDGLAHCPKHFFQKVDCRIRLGRSEHQRQGTLDSAERPTRDGCVVEACRSGFVCDCFAHLVRGCNVYRRAVDEYFIVQLGGENALGGVQIHSSDMRSLWNHGEDDLLIVLLSVVLQLRMMILSTHRTLGHLFTGSADLDSVFACLGLELL